MPEQYVEPNHTTRSFAPRLELQAAKLVEQHAKVALQVTQSALVLNRGRVSYTAPSAELLADPQRLTSLVVA